MTDVSDGGRVPVLRAVLRLWDDLRNGVDAEVLGRRLDETARRAVGGHLETGDGRLCAPSELRRQVVEWLRPRQPAASGSAAAAEFGVFLVSWGLSIDPDWVERWRETVRDPPPEPRTRATMTTATRPRWCSVRLSVRTARGVSRRRSRPSAVPLLGSERRMCRRRNTRRASSVRAEARASGDVWMRAPSESRHGRSQLPYSVTPRVPSTR